MTEKSLTELLDEARTRIGLLAQSLPLVADPSSVSLTAKTPWKALVFRETLIWRTEEMARVACDLYTTGQLATALTVTRSCVEGVAACWYLYEILRKVVDCKDIGGLDEKLIRLMMGSKNGITGIVAINVLMFIDAFDRKAPGFRRAYDSLCEFAHPNWSGTALLFSKDDREKILTELGRNMRDNQWVSKMGLHSLVGSLMAFEYSYNQISDMLPAVIELCETDIRAQSA
jgi:hypothetical protein